MPDSLQKTTQVNLIAGMSVDLLSETSVTAGNGGRAFGVSDGVFAAGTLATIWVTGSRNALLAPNQSVSIGDRLRCTSSGLVKAMPGYTGWIIGRSMQAATSGDIATMIQIRVAPGQVSL